jgi:hypothetical protein
MVSIPSKGIRNAKISYNANYKLHQLKKPTNKVQRGKDQVPACQVHKLSIKAKNENIIHHMSTTFEVLSKHA